MTNYINKTYTRLTNKDTNIKYSLKLKYGNVSEIVTRGYEFYVGIETGGLVIISYQYDKYHIPTHPLNRFREKHEIDTVAHVTSRKKT